MHCFLIVGAGRSGTSLVASLFRHSPVAPVSSFAPRQANPLGFFEDERVNAVNESILRRYVPPAATPDPCGYGADTPAPGQYWLARIGLANTISANEREQQSIRAITRSAGFCIKDPRLSYTHACWWECLSQAQRQSLKTICVFRHPAHVLNSVLREVLQAGYLQNLALSRQQILANWRLQYEWILQKHAQRGAWFFCDYEALLAGRCFEALEQFCQLDLDRSVICPDLNRSSIALEVDASLLDLHHHLRQRATESTTAFQPAPIASEARRQRLVMTLLCRNEIDIIRAHLDVHLQLGVDHIVVTDNASSDGTREVLRDYERQGKITLLLEEDLTHDQAVWVTRMADMARDALGADWLLHSDADEFWLPRSGNLSTYFQQLDPALQLLEVPRSNMLPPPLESMDQPLPFHVRQLIRELDSLDNLGKPILGKVCHRALAGVEVHDGNHGITIAGQQQTATPAIDLEIIHFPVRNLAQLERKIRDGSEALQRNTRIDPLTGITWRELRRRLDAEGSLASYYRSLCLDPATIQQHRQAGRLVKEDRIFRLLTRSAAHALAGVGASP